MLTRRTMLRALGLGAPADACEAQEEPESSRYDEQMAKLRRHITDSYAYMYEPPVMPRLRLSGVDVPIDKIESPCRSICFDFTTGTITGRF